MDYLDLCKKLKILEIKAIDNLELEDYDNQTESGEDFRECTVTQRLTLSNGDSVEFTHFYEQLPGKPFDFADCPTETDAYYPLENGAGLLSSSGNLADRLGGYTDEELEDQGYTENLVAHVLDAMENAALSPTEVLEKLNEINNKQQTLDSQAQRLTDCKRDLVRRHLETTLKADGFDTATGKKITDHIQKSKKKKTLL